MKKAVIFRFVEGIARFFMGLLLKILHKEWDESQWAAFDQFVDYCVVGVLNVIVNYAVYATVILLLRLTDWGGVFLGIPYCNVHLATVLGFVAMVINSFYWNGRYTFRIEEATAARRRTMLGKVFLSYCTAMLVQLGLNVLLSTVLHVPELLINPIDQIVTIPLTFLLNKYWAFR